MEHLSDEKPTLKEWLAYTTKAMEKGLEAQQIWDVMTAMRGPDRFESLETADILKDRTTARIRYACFGDTPLRHGGACINSDENYADAKEATDKEGWGHFPSHIRYALEALRDVGIIKQ